MTIYSRRRTRPRLVCLIGVDGTGKTTQSAALAEVLRKEGVDARRVPCRWDSATVRAVMRLGIKLFSRRGRNLAAYTERSKAKGRLFRNKLAAWAYQELVLTQYVFQIWTKVKLPLLRGKSVVCDRYVYDSVIDLAVDFNYTVERTERMLDKLFRLAPRPDTAILIDLDEETAMARNAVKNEGLDRVYFRERLALYRLLARKSGMIVIDGTQGMDQIGSSLRAIVLDKTKV